eukprot:g26175.t1
MAMLWVDKHRPKVLAELDYHRDLSDRLRRIAGSGEMPHILMCGPSGAGKSTRVHALLREIYGSGVDTVKVETKSIVGSVLHLVASSLVGGPSCGDAADQRSCLSSSVGWAFFQGGGDRGSRRIVIGGSGCTEKNNGKEIAAVLTKVSIAEGLKLAADLSHKIAEKSGRDMRRAMILLEMMHTQANASSLSKDVAVPSEAWQTAIDKVAKKILQEQTPRMAMEVRGNIYELLLACLPADFILKDSFGSLIHSG